MDMRHRSTPGDRPTVREPIPQGQTGGRPARPATRVSLWMNSCRCRRALVTFGLSESFPARIGRPPATSVRPVTLPRKPPLTCEDLRWWPRLAGCLAALSTGPSPGSQSVEKAVDRHRRQPGTTRAPTNEGNPVENNSEPAGPPASPDELAEAWHRILDEPPAQPAGLAAHQRAGHPAREHRHRRGPQRLHPRPGRGPAARPARGRPQRRLRPGDPDRGHRQPGARRPQPRTAYDENLDQPTSPQDSLSTMGPC